MGKKAKFKKLRQLAQQLPELNTKQVVGEHFMGYELIKEHGIETIGQGDNEKPVDPEGRYSRKKVVEVPINHNRNLKRAFYQGGMGMAGQYAMAVAQHAARLKAEQAPKPQPEKEVQP